MLVHRRVTPSSKFAGTHFYTWVERGTMGVKCLAQQYNVVPRPGLEPGLFDPESSALTIRPPRLPPIELALVKFPRESNDFSLNRQINDATFAYYELVFRHADIKWSIEALVKLFRSLIHPWLSFNLAYIKPQISTWLRQSKCFLYSVFLTRNINASSRQF